MKRIIWMLAGLWMATGAWAGERSFVLTTAGEVEDGLAGRVRDYLEQFGGAAVRLASPVAIQPGESLEATGRAAAKTLGENDHSIIVLARPDTAQPQGVCLPRERFGILNLNRLAEKDPDGKFERRVGQDALRVMSMLLDMSPCPFPLCLLVGYEKTEDLDQMSGNFCPPCKDRFLRLAREAGIRILEPEPAPAEAPAPEAAAAE